MINKHLFWLIVFVVEFSVNTANYAGGQSESCQSFDNSIRPYGVCPSINIKSIQSFKQLENCTVVEGYLQIAILHIPRDVVERLSFPDLREITDFLLIYRVTGLESFRNIFPNLSVIRGRQLFNFYSIVIYENRDLQELGLVNLRVISRGAIKFARNFKLCYIETVDWTQLGVHKLSIEFQKNNQQCPNTCKSECESKHCWSYYDCQKGFACGCKENQSCMENKTCCHEYCLGGCKGTTAEDCYSCKDVIFNNTCRPQCPPGTYTHLNRRCLTDRECLSLKNNSEGRSPKLLHGEKGEPNYCVYNCPQNYTSSESKEKNYTECVKCTEFCHKECNGLEITGIQDAQKLQGCSKIVGSLTIQILKGTAAAEDELEKSLGSIREITQVLTIKKSLVLYSLRFLKSLEIIGSASNGTSGIAFTLIDNQNLQELFPVDQMKKLKILNGRLHFYDNHQLCLHKIDEFVQYLNLTNVEGINRFTNGDQRPCLQDLLNLTVNVYSHTSVVLKWDKYKAEHRMLLTYILNYKEVSHLNDIPTVQYGRDSCSNDVWMTREYPPVDGPDTFQLGLLRELKPFTPYAVYVQAYTVTTATHSAMTDVITFKTLPFFPSEPRDLIAISENPNELRVKWKPPKAPNGIVKYYKIVYQKLELNEKPYNQRNYCTEKHYLPPKEKEVIRIDEEEKKFNYSKDCCKCPKSKEEEDDENQKRQVEIFFEDYLHKNIYCKRYDKLPEEVDNTLATISIDYIMEHSVGEELWRSIEERNNETSLNETLLAETLSIGGGFGVIDEGGGLLQEANNVSFTNVMEVEVYNSTEAVLPNLEHFSEYSIEVMACHDTNTNLSNGLKYCSIRAITLETTKPDWHMDLINESSIVVEVEKNFTNRVYIKWDSPPKPNGLILNYLISYKKANQDNVVPQPLCVNRTEYLKNHGHRFKVIDYGNYSFKLSAISLAGNDLYTQEKFFFVPKPPESESSSTLMIVVAVIGITLIVCIVVVAAFTYYRYKIPTGPTVISRNMNYVSSDYVYRPDEWEVSRDKIKLIKELGQGSFGMVYEGVAKGLSVDDPEEEIRVAVKTVNERASYSDKQEFLKEATIMNHEISTKTKNELIQREPDFIQREPDFIQREPDFIQRAPDLIQREPDFIQRAPDLLQREPDFIQREPDFIQREPDFIQREPDFIQREPDFIQREPDFIQREPDFIQRAPDLFNESRTSFNERRTYFNESRTSFNESRTSFNESRTSFNESRTSFNESRTSFNESRTSFNESRTSFNESRT
ncbi:hypothetical protein Btru_068698 [Bulinus truncatus]|nr:hypothetical protein Btru_068698 [Bulinus truncatus]